ncbi:hypothetical protein CPB86DRAFT_258686 [Serendipita vermifera]|nr:hypothetical protein CPB86DRAFT_258686 [Serendipita vermifera]
MTVIAPFDDPNVKATGSWALGNTCGNYTDTIGNSVSLTFTGTSVSFVGVRCHSGGIVSFSLDGEPQGTVNTDWTTNDPPLSCNQLFYHSS